MAVIYIISNSINYKKYVGQTVLNPPIRRWYHHLGVARRKPNKNDMLITKAIRKYGQDKFRIEYFPLHSGATQNLLNQMECLVIKKYNAMSPNGYNLKAGGSNGKFSLETRHKLSNLRMGFSHSEATKMALRGPRGPYKRHSKPRSQSHKDAISLAMMGNKNAVKSLDS